MSEERNNNEEVELTLDQKIDIIGDVVVDIHQLLTSIIETVQQQQQPPQMGVPSQAGYPVQTQPLQPMENRYASNSQYSAPEEQYRNNRTYTQMPQTQQEQQPPPNNQPPPIPNTGERVMTPEEYRKEYGE